MKLHGCHCYHHCFLFFISGPKKKRKRPGGTQGDVINYYQEIAREGNGQRDPWNQVKLLGNAP